MYICSVNLWGFTSALISRLMLVAEMIPLTSGRLIKPFDIEIVVRDILGFGGMLFLLR